MNFLVNHFQLKLPEKNLKQFFPQIFIILLQGCEPQLTPEEVHKQEIFSAGFQASLTATYYVSAFRSCNSIGIRDIGHCAQIQSNLLLEQGAQMNANLAMKQIQVFQKDCRDKFSQEYCDALLSRAIEITFNQAD